MGVVSLENLDSFEKNGREERYEGEKTREAGGKEPYRTLPCPQTTCARLSHGPPRWENYSNRSFFRLDFDKR